MATTDEMGMPAEMAERGEAGSLLLWILVWSELAAFGALLVAFMVMTVMDSEGASLLRVHLHSGLAALNSVLLVFSGWQAALAVRRGTDAVRRPLVFAALSGLAFTVMKLVEYSVEIRSGISAAGGLSELYFIVTGFHLLHVIFGAGILLIVAWRPSRENVVMIATLWHVVDLIWLVMFPIVYLT
ncbi:cytochrome c oxidase subunit 3 [Sinorhizobium sp. BG8]|uniref:cytochrome c oxidase subunit 3 n=1 Tax=Sinorhizobium sp. BG8 TaxID=2613773 RepID=UPI00193E1159|nr:cytochrome c oxidase subunit 3 [Sinorhizobium sp. BG8]QRM57155.1 cytochrome c oxidase subunit 3 family protein [Sinorhizobium sp. BG8]